MRALCQLRVSAAHGLVPLGRRPQREHAPDRPTNRPERGPRFPELGRSRSPFDISGARASEPPRRGDVLSPIAVRTVGTPRTASGAPTLRPRRPGGQGRTPGILHSHPLTRKVGMRDGSPRPCPAPGSPPGGTEPRSPPETSTPPCASETGGPPPGASKRQTPEGTRGVGGLRSFTSGRMSWGHGGNQPSPVVGEAKVRVPVLPLAPPPLGVAGDGHHTSPEASQTRARQRVGEAPDRDGAQRQEPALRLSGQGGAATRPPKCTSRVSWEGGRPVAPRGARRPLSRLGRHAGREGFPPGKLRLCGAEVRSPSRGGPRCQRQGQEPPSPGNRPGSWGGWGGQRGRCSHTCRQEIM